MLTIWELKRRKTECIFSVRKLGRRPNVVRQFMTISNGAEGSGDGAQNCTVSVIDFATPPSPKPPNASNSDADPTPPSASSDAGRTGPHRVPDLLVDRVIERAEETTASRTNPGRSHFVKGNGIFVGGNSTLTFFSEARLKSISQCLGHDRVSELVARISSTVQQHLRSAANFSPDLSAPKRAPPCLNDRARVLQCIKLYFERVHPSFPFLDRAAFEATAAAQGQPNTVPRSKSWTSLYYTVLALGSQYDGGGSFNPGRGESWELFSAALANFTNLMLLPDSLTTLQALTAMTIYSMGMSSIGLDHIIISEAVRRAQNLAEARFNNYATLAYRRTFWVLYGLEKVTSFNHGRSSGFSDCDISCPIPSTPECYFGDFNWFVAFIRYARLLSRAYTSLFSVGVSDNADEYFLDIVDQLTEEIEDWRTALPDNGFRPGGSVKPTSLPVSSDMRAMALIIHFFYNSFLQTISRMALRHLPPSNHARREAMFDRVEKTSQSILELTSLIEVAPYTSMWMLVGIPMTGFFVLFDLVIHNPRQQQATSNLALLDIAAGHASQLEYVSEGAIPGSIIGEFVHIARTYVGEVNGQSVAGGTTQQPLPQTGQVLFSQPHWSLPHDEIEEFAAMDVAADFSEMNLAVDSGPPGVGGPMDIEGFPMGPNTFMGTDVMNLFGYFMPDWEPLVFPGQTSQHDISASNYPDDQLDAHQP
ncbi:putative transcriptional regulatory protein [Colletotrichum tropicale]|nr:putative transcriptional regulatory protein [Colletotrichum tropicale]